MVETKAEATGLETMEAGENPLSGTRLSGCVARARRPGSRREEPLAHGEIARGA